MREILFRGKNADTGEWVYGYLSSEHTISVTSTIGNWDEIVIDPYTVGQYTGIEDQNGTKIFEGDICRISFDGEEIEEKYFEVKWSNGNCEYIADSNEESIGLGYVSVLDVVGNIYDNQELLM